MNLKNLISWGLLGVALLLFWSAGSAFGFEPQTLVNFQVGPGTVTGNLVECPDGNFYGTTTHGGPLGSGTIFRVTPAGILTTLISGQANPAAGLVVGNEWLALWHERSWRSIRMGSVFQDDDWRRPDQFRGARRRQRREPAIRFGAGQRRKFLWRLSRRRRQLP